MRYEYISAAYASKLFYAKEVPGLPEDVEIDFNNVYVRAYKSENNPGYFGCSLAIPKHKDCDGYVLEINFSDLNNSIENDNPREDYFCDMESEFYNEDSFSFEYEVQLNDHDFETLTRAMRCTFSDEYDEGRRSLLFNLVISGTPFNGYAFISPWLYKVKN
ncbi:hypothetical protein [Halomonas sp.]|uniref:hypothetical protein n=1 Tax=Halomonas sp. TaxID=1486246 RepID=UPI00384C0552